MATLLPGSSPRWNSTTKLAVGMSIFVIFAAMIIYFRVIIGPLLLVFILSYLMHPLADRLSRLRGLSWRMSVNIIYISLVIILLATTTLTGLAVIQEAQSLVDIVQEFLGGLPVLLDEIASTPLKLGPLTLDLSAYLNLETIGQQAINNVQIVVEQAGSVIGTVATRTASLFGWAVFVLIVSYFIVADARKVPDAARAIVIPGYAEDIRRISRETGKIWNAFLRGQITIVFMVILTYTALLSILGVRYSLAIAILAGMARFVPYLGPFITYIVMGLVTIFQPFNYFGLEPWQYSILVIGISALVDQAYDQLVAPRVLGQSLGVHPAAVLVVAIIAFNFIGVVGLVLAAPVLATVQMVGRYTIRKLFDLDPWPESEEKDLTKQPPWMVRLSQRFYNWWQKKRKKL